MALYQNLQWLNHNALRSYPLVDTSTKTDTTGTFVIHDSFIVGLEFPVHSGLDVEPDLFFVSQITASPTGYGITISYDDGSPSPPAVATASIAASTFIENSVYALPGKDNFADSFGWIVIGRLADIVKQPPGQFNFAPAAASLEVDAIRPMIRGISSVIVANGADVSAPLYGDLLFSAGTNMQLVVNQIEGQPPEIIFNAISGEGLNNDCACTTGTPTTPIQTINGIPPTHDGNFTLLGDDCLNLNPIANGLQAIDKCSQPCCGCTELAAVVQQYQRFADGYASLSTFVNNLNAAVLQFQNGILGSRLGDQGCITC